MCGLRIGLGLGLGIGLVLVLQYIRWFTIYMVSFTYMDLADTVTATSLAPYGTYLSHLTK